MDPTERVQLGRSAVHVSRLGLGMAALGDAGRVSDADAAAVLARTQSLGLRHIDTAAEYGLGLAERRLGAALAAGAAADLVVSTKVGRLIRPATRGYRIRHTIQESFSSVAGLKLLGRKLSWTGRRVLDRHGSSPGPSGTAPAGSLARRDLGDVPAAICDFSYDGAMRSFEESLERLGSDRLELAFIHEPDLHVGQASRSAYAALDRLRAAGSIGAVGVAINDPDALLTFAERGDYDCFLLGGRYTLLEQPALDRLLPLALERGISILLGGPFNSGILANPIAGALYDYRPADRRRLAAAQKMAAIAERHGVELKAAALQFPLGHPAIASVLVGAATVAELEEDAALMAVPIPGAFWEELRSADLLRPDAPAPASSGPVGAPRDRHQSPAGPAS